MNDYEANPSHVVLVEDFSSDTLENLIAHLEVSSQFEHFIYRESEMDSLWRLVEMAVKAEADGPKAPQLRRLLSAAREAHDLVAEEKPREAADRLREVMSLTT
jgi:hypothetical protein